MRNGNRRIARLAATGMVAAISLSLLAAAPASAARDVTDTCSAAPEDGFTDVGPNHDPSATPPVNNPLEQASDCVVAYGVANGQTTTTLNPTGKVSRNQMATFIMQKMDKVTGFTRPANSPNAFTDDDSLPAANHKNINDGAALDLFNGKNKDANGNTVTPFFDPSGNVTRGQMATFIVNQLKAAGVTLPTSPPNAFTDDNGDIHEANINILAALDIVDGLVGDVNGDGQTPDYGPGQDISRGQMMFFLARDIDVMVEAGKIPRIAGGNTTVTTRPELKTAVLGATVTASDVTPTNPIGQRMTLTFDEPIASVTGGGVFVYNAVGGGFFPCNATNGAISGASIVYNCPAVDTTAERNGLSVVGIDEGAVTDFQGQTNPFNDGAIGAAASGTGGAGGVTNAPDVTNFDAFRQGAGATDTAVNVTLDEAAFVQNAAGFHLVNTQGDQIDCTGPAPGTTNASGGTVAGGNGTVTLTIICPSLGANAPLPAASIARGFLDAGTVGDASGGGNLNPLQAADATGGSGGNTDEPDLVQAVFQPDAVEGGAAVDAVVYQFENNLTATGAGTLFFVYNAASAATAGGATTTSGQQVRVIFPNGTLGDAIGASVEDGAVTSAAGANEEDEVAVTNNFVTNLTPGQASFPQLTKVELVTVPSNFPGDPATTNAVYTLDEALASIVQTQWFLYTGSGARLESTACTIGTGAATNVVTCTAFNVTSSGNPATSAQIASALLAAVDDGGPSGTGSGGGTDVTREDSQPTTGGTGTATA